MCIFPLGCGFAKNNGAKLQQLCMYFFVSVQKCYVSIVKNKVLSHMKMICPKIFILVRTCFVRT